MSDDDRARFHRIRAAVLLIWAGVAFMTPYGAYTRLPDELSVPQGIGRILLDVDVLRDLLWSERALTILKWLAIAGCLAQLAAGRRLRRLMPLLFLVVLALDAATKSLTGYVNHAQIAPLLVLFLVAVFDGDAAAERDGVWLVRLSLAIPYTFIGLHRLIAGGLEIYTGDALLQYIAQNTAGYSYYGWTIGLRLIEMPLAAGLLKAGFALMTIFEVLSIAALISGRFRRVWLWAIAGFHVLTLVTMNIFFWENLVLLLAAFGPLSGIAWMRSSGRRLRARRRRAPSSRAAASATTAIATASARTARSAPAIRHGRARTCHQGRQAPASACAD